MKKLWLSVAVIMVALGAQAQTKERYQQKGEATAAVPTAKAAPVAAVTFHVTHSFLAPGWNGTYQHLMGVLKGRNVELVGVAGPAGDLAYISLLPLGDYVLLPTTLKTEKNGTVLEQYKLVYPDGETSVYGVIGVSE